MNTNKKPLSGIMVTTEFEEACCKVLGIDQFTPHDIPDAWAQMPAIEAEMAKTGARLRRGVDRDGEWEEVGPDGNLMN
jgi:hypothetical protein